MIVYYRYRGDVAAVNKMGSTMIFKFKVFKTDESKCGYYDFYTAMASTKSKAKKIICSHHPDIEEDELEDDFYLNEL